LSRTSRKGYDGLEPETWRQNIKKDAGYRKKSGPRVENSHMKGAGSVKLGCERPGIYLTSRGERLGDQGSLERGGKKKKIVEKTENKKEREVSERCYRFQKQEKGM